MYRYRLLNSIPLVAIGLAVLLAANLAAAADWPRFRGPEDNGTTPERIDPHWGAAGPKVLWKIPLGASFGSFSTGGGKLYVVEKHGDNEAISAFDPATGNRLWQRDIDKTIYDREGGDGPRSTAAWDSGKLYALSTYLKLLCLDPSDGRVIWQHELLNEFGGQKLGWGSAASPLVDGNIVFVCSGARGQSLMAFDKNTGQIAWKGQDDPMTHATPIVGSVLDVRQVIFFTQKGLVSVVPQTGQVLWRQPFRYNVSTAASPVICGEDIVYCTAGYGSGTAAYRISRTAEGFKSTELWLKHSNHLVNQWSTPVYKDGFLYGVYGFKEFATEPLKCIDVLTGKEKWAREGMGQGQVIMAGGVLIVQCDYGDVVLVQPMPDGYHEIARCHPWDGRPKCWTDPAVANGRIYLRSQTGGICLDAK